MEHHNRRIAFLERVRNSVSLAARPQGKAPRGYPVPFLLTQKSGQSPRIAFLCLAALAATLLGPALAAYAQAESLDDWPAKIKAGGYSEPLKADKSVQFLGLSKVLSSGTWTGPADEEAFADYYEKRYFPMVTHLDVRGSRDDPVIFLRNSFKRIPLASVVADKLTDITLAYMVPIVKDAKWPPTVRENALLAIGEVKSTKAVGTVMAIINDKNSPAVLKVVAMADLVHLAEEGLVAGSPSEASIVALMTKAARSNPEKPADSLLWMRGQAADVLAAIGSTGTSGEVPQALLAMVADERLALFVRQKAARAVGKLNYTGTLPDAAVYAKAFAVFGSDALDANLPGEARRIWAVCEDFVGGLKPLMDAGSPPKVARDMFDAMAALKKVASRIKPNGSYPSEEDLKPAVEKARKVLDAAAGRK